MTVAEFARLLSGRPQNTEMESFRHDHSLQSIAREHAVQSGTMRAGTAFDWEDLEEYQAELERLDREGPGAAKRR